MFGGGEESNHAEVKDFARILPAGPGHDDLACRIVAKRRVVVTKMAKLGLREPRYRCDC